MSFADTLALISDIIQSTVVIFGASIALYYLRAAVRDRISRAFTSLLFFVVAVYFAELIALRAAFAFSLEVWLRLQWLGIAMVPAAQFHLADALLNTTGAVSRRRRLLVRFCYLVGLAFFALVMTTDLVVAGLATSPEVPYLLPGPLFWVFTAYFWTVTGVSLRNVWLARSRARTTTTRQRMTTISLVFVAAPVSVFPYLLTSGFLTAYPEILWLAVIAGNVVVGVMFTLLTVRVAYFAFPTPDHLVRVRLYKYVARAPLAASIVLVVYVLVSRTSSFLGLPVESAVAIAVVATIILVEGAIHVYKRPLERLFQLTDDPDVERVQELSSRVLTTRELHEFLESLLASACNLLQTPTAFITSVTPEGPELEVVVGPLAEQDESFWRSGELRTLAMVGENGNSDVTPVHANLETAGDFFVWRGFWLHTLQGSKREGMVGVLGIRARSETPDLNEYERAVYGRVLQQAAAALEDRALQREVFAALEGMLPPRAVQELRRRTISDPHSDSALTSDDANDVLDDPNFNTLVRDALSHYWGGPKLTESPLLGLRVVQQALEENEGNPTKALRTILNEAIEMQKPEGERSLTTAKWILYNILELKFVQGRKVRDVARRLAMSESDLYRKQRVAIENVARALYTMEEAAVQDETVEQDDPPPAG